MANEDKLVEEVIGEAILSRLRDRKGFRQILDEIENDGTGLFMEIKLDLGATAAKAYAEEMS